MANQLLPWSNEKHIFIESRAINCMNKVDDDIRADILKVIREPSPPVSIYLTEYSGNLLALLAPIEDDLKKSGVENIGCDTHRVGYF